MKLGIKTLKVILDEGPKGISFRINHLIVVELQANLSITNVEPEPESISYREWLAQHQDEHTTGATKILDTLSNQPLISIVCPVFNPDPDDFEVAILSVLNQTYENWELCLADDCSDDFDIDVFLEKFSDPRIKCAKRATNGNISRATNTAIDLTTGKFVGFLDQDDVLSPLALFWIVVELNNRPNLKFLYSDEDKLDESANRCDPHFKPDWNYHYFLTCNYICHIAVYRRDFLTELGGCRVGMEGAQDYDLALRAIEQLEPTEIHHIPRILYHWRKHPDSTSQNALAKPYALEAGERALKDHIERTKNNAQVTTNFIKYEVHYESPDPAPSISIIIPTQNQCELLKTCIDSIDERTTYSAYEIVIVDNESDDETTMAYLEQFANQPGHRVIRDDKPFNFSRLMNDAVSQCKSEYICFLNNDIEVISKNWLTEMISVITQEDVAIVGAKLLYSDNSIQHGGVILGIGGVAGHAHKYFPDGHPGYVDRLQSRQELSAVTGACMLTNKSTFERVHGMDEEHLSIAFNDIDYCLKVQDLGLKTVWTPHAKLYHHESKSRGLEDTLIKQKRYSKEVKTMKDRWGKRLLEDPAYNPNLTLTYEDFTLAPRSRNQSISDLLDTITKP